MNINIDTNVVLHTNANANAYTPVVSHTNTYVVSHTNTNTANINTKERFYYKLKDSSKCYSISIEAIELIDLFKKMHDSDKKSSLSPEFAIELPQIYVDDTKFNAKPYYLNTLDIIEFVNSYIKLWEHRYKSANYLKEETVQTGNPEQIIHQDDLKLIRSYIKDRYEELSLNEQKLITDNKLYNKQFSIDALSTLVKNVDGYLIIESLKNKLYAYIATIIWTCSMKELSEIASDDRFLEMQNDSIKEWNLKNSKVPKVVKSNTAGDGNNVNKVNNDRDNNDRDNGHDNGVKICHDGSYKNDRDSSRDNCHDRDNNNDSSRDRDNDQDLED